MAGRRLPVVAAVALVLCSTLQGGTSDFSQRRYFCRDRYGYVGDCNGGHYNSGSVYGYGRRHSGEYVGRGYYNLAGRRHAELVCDFYADGRVRDPVYNIVWRKISYSPYSSRYDRGYSAGSSYDDWYSNRDYEFSTRVYTRDSRSTLFLRDYRYSDEGTYRCYGTVRSRYGRDRTVYMDVAFFPLRNRYDHKK